MTIVLLLLVVLAWLAWPTAQLADRAGVDRPSVDPDAARRRPPADESTVDSTRKIVVLDLANGDAVPHLDLRIAGKIVRSDAAGVVRLGEVEDATIEVVGEDWFHIPNPRKAPLSTGEFWVFRRLRVEATVRAEGGDESFDPARVALHVFVDDESPAAWVASEDDRDRVVRRSRKGDKSVGEDGRFSMTTPRVRGVVLGASLDGWRPDTVRLDEFLNGERATVELVLTRGHRVKGVLVDEDGKAICFCGVRAFTTVRVSAADVARPGRLQHLQPNGGYKASGSNVTGEGAAVYRSRCRTGARGEFDLPITVEGGQTHLLCYAPGYRPVELDLGAIKGDREDIRLVAERAPEGQSTRIVVNGTPLADTSILVTDLEFGDCQAQPSITLSTDSMGNVITEWLIWGRRYSLDRVNMAGGQALRGCLVWKNLESVELAKDLLEYSDLFPQR